MHSKEVPDPLLVFTVYQTQTTVELHQRNQDIPARVICSLKSYDAAKRLGALAAEIRGLLFINCVHPDDV